MVPALPGFTGHPHEYIGHLDINVRHRQAPYVDCTVESRDDKIKELKAARESSSTSNYGFTVPCLSSSDSRYTTL